MENERLRLLKSIQANRSSGKWMAHKNTSWGEWHKKEFGDKSGYTICHTGKHNEIECIGTVLVRPFATQSESDANLMLMVAAPKMLDALMGFALLDKNKYPELAELIHSAIDAIGSVEDIMVKPKFFGK